MGERFPDLSDAYDTFLISLANHCANNQGIKLKQGIYAGVSGPNLETPAEYHFLRMVGADAVGMSTIPEVITARQCGIRCFAASIITDLGVPGKIKKVNLEEIKAVASVSEPLLTRLIQAMVTELI